MAVLRARSQPGEWNGVVKEQADGGGDAPHTGGRPARGLPDSVAIVFRRLREAATAHDDD